MKTTWDAVNGLQGDLSRHAIHRGDEMYILYHELNDWYVTTTNKFPSPDGPYQHIGTVDEFNAIVLEMSLGLDVNPINEGYYHKYLDADKEVLKPIKQQPNIYTQEMCDNGELPPIGSLFIDVELSDDEQVEAMAYDLELGRVIYKRGSTLQDSEYFGAQTHECKPIQPRVELINGKAYQFDYTGEYIGVIEIVAIYSKAEHKLKSLTRNCHLKDCTNIKPLTVKGE